MSLTECKECGQKVSTKAEKCPHCGAPQVSTLAEINKHGCLGGIILFAIIAIIFMTSIDNRHSSFNNSLPKNKQSSSHKLRGMDLIHASISMEMFVKENLKSPSAAKFQHMEDMHVKYLGDQEYEIKSYVDSSNSFGAIMRTKFMVRMKKADGDKWKLLDLKFYE